MTQSQLDKVLALRGKMSTREAADKVGIDRGSVSKVWRGIVPKHLGGVSTPKAAPSSGCIAVRDVLVQYDLVGKILEHVALTAPGAVWKDDSLRMELGVGGDKWRRATGSMRLSGFWTNLPDKTRVWGTKSTISRLSSQIKEL